MAATQATGTEFPYSVTVSLPLPTNRLASSALRALEVDTELSLFVQRTFALKAPDSDDKNTESDEGKTVLETTYKATTNRMLRVAVNGFMESLGVVLGVMEELDVDVLEEDDKKL
ncbi:transcription factor Pcc1-domain-containing protein [Aspergillus crustosus]